MDFIKDTYIPYIVKKAIKKDKPKTEEEFVEFSQDLFEQIKKKVKEIKQVVNN